MKWKPLLSGLGLDGDWSGKVRFGLPGSLCSLFFSCISIIVALFITIITSLLWFRGLYFCGAKERNLFRARWDYLELLRPSSLVHPVFKMKQLWKMNCGADSRNASKSPELRVSCLIFATRSEFCGKLVSNNDKAIKERRFLESNNAFQTYNFFRRLCWWYWDNFWSRTQNSAAN